MKLKQEIMSYNSGDYVVCGNPPYGQGSVCIAHLINGQLIPGGDPVRLACLEEIQNYLAKPGKKEVGERDFVVNKSTTEPYVSGSIAEIRYYSDGSFEFYDYKGHKTFTSILKPQTMSEKRTLELTLEQARELYKKDQYTGALLRMFFTKEELEGGDLPSWEELGVMKGWVISEKGISKMDFRIACKNIFATESQARSALAMAQLSQLMKALGDECKVDSLNKGHKYSITRMIDRLEPVNSSEYYFLSFKTALVRDAFLKKHEELIKQYFEL